jgi:hypothetical protein
MKPAGMCSFLQSALLKLFILDFLIFFFPKSIAAQQIKPVFVRADCNGQLSSAVLNTLKENLRASQKYQLISSVDDNGRMDVVLQVNVSCAERDNFAALGAVYGVAKCFGPRNCRVTMDGSSVTAILCDRNGIGECGRLFFQSFDNYVGHLNPSLPKLE